MRNNILTLARRVLFLLYGVAFPTIAVFLFLSAANAERISEPTNSAQRLTANVISAILWCLYLWGSALAFASEYWGLIYPDYKGSGLSALKLIWGVAVMVFWIFFSATISVATLTYMFRNSWVAQIVAVAIGTVILGVPGAIHVIRLFKFLKM